MDGWMDGVCHTRTSDAVRNAESDAERLARGIPVVSDIDAIEYDVALPRSGHDLFASDQRWPRIDGECIRYEPRAIA